jgi:hypothetical protein
MPTDAHAAGPERTGIGTSSLVAGVLVGLQAVLLAMASVLLAVAGLRSETSDLADAEVLAAIGLASAATVGFLARGVALRRRWARSPVLVLELICLPIAVTVVQKGHWYAGFPLAASAIVVLVLLGVSGQLARPED